MATVTDHYENHLAGHYSWLFGGITARCRENMAFFTRHDIKPFADGRAIDLGCGSGFQSIPLARAGFKVTGIDLSSKLLEELARNKGELAIATVNDDLSNVDIHCPPAAELIVCMGDTLTHLETMERVEKLFRKIYRHLRDKGRFIVTYRDLDLEVSALDRFIPVKSDDGTIFTCFLEYEENHVKVHDLIYEKTESGAWIFKKSFYRKLRIPLKWIMNKLLEIGFSIRFSHSERGVSTIIALKEETELFLLKADS